MREGWVTLRIEVGEGAGGEGGGEDVKRSNRIDRSRFHATEVDRTRGYNGLPVPFAQIMARRTAVECACARRSAIVAPPAIDFVSTHTETQTPFWENTTIELTRVNNRSVVT